MPKYEVTVSGDPIAHNLLDTCTSHRSAALLGAHSAYDEDEVIRVKDQKGKTTQWVRSADGKNVRRYGGQSNGR